METCEFCLNHKDTQRLTWALGLSAALHIFILSILFANAEKPKLSVVELGEMTIDLTHKPAKLIVKGDFR